MAAVGENADLWAKVRERVPIFHLHRVACPLRCAQFAVTRRASKPFCPLSCSDGANAPPAPAGIAACLPACARSGRRPTPLSSTQWNKHGGRLTLLARRCVGPSRRAADPRPEPIARGRTCARVRALVARLLRSS